MYTHTVRRQDGEEVVETRTNVSRQIYDQLLSQVRDSHQVLNKIFNFDTKQIILVSIALNQ